MALYKPDTLRSSNTKAYPIVYGEEVGGHKQVADLSTLYELGNYSPIILGSGDETTAIGQLWYVISEKSFYQLVDYSNISNSNGWSKINLTSITNFLSSNQIGNDNTLITSITVASDGSMSYTSYSLSSIKAGTKASYDLANKSYTYANNLGTYLNTRVNTTYDLASKSYTYANNLGTYLNTRVNTTYDLASKSYTYANNLGTYLNTRINTTYNNIINNTTFIKQETSTPINLQNIWVGSYSQYQALSTKSDTTIYCITE